MNEKMETSRDVASGAKGTTQRSDLPFGSARPAGRVPGVELPPPFGRTSEVATELEQERL
jgi:hypothetical protein